MADSNNFQNAVNWALEQDVSGDDEPSKTPEKIHKVMELVRMYFETNNIAYQGFTSKKIVNYLPEDFQQ